jgi:hypothetical protein
MVQQLAVIGVGPRARRLGGLGRTLGHGIDDAHQPRSLERAEDPGVMPAEVADADHAGRSGAPAGYPR